jgi:hypothetical protein
MSILALTSNTLVTAASGQIEYDGQFFATDSAASRAQLQRIVRTTAVNSTSGTSIDFTGIPAWVERITVMFSGVSTSGTSIKQIQLGDSGGFEATGYLGSGIQLTDGSSVNSGASTTGIQIRSALAADVLHGAVIITNITGNTWVAHGTLTDSSRLAGYLVGGNKTLSDVLTQVRITTVNGTDTFDAGSINIIYEG